MAKSKPVPKVKTPPRHSPSLSEQLELTQAKLDYTESLLQKSHARVTELNNNIDLLLTQNSTVSNLRKFINSLVDGHVFQYNSSNDYLSKINPAKLNPGSAEFQALCSYAGGLLDVKQLRIESDPNSRPIFLIDYIYNRAIQQRINQLLVSKNQSYRDMVIAAGRVIGYDCLQERPPVKPDVSWLTGEQSESAKAA